MTDEARNGADGPLKGVRVLDWTMFQFGPVGASMLGDMGADVTKIEALDGDVGRAVARMSSRPIGLEGGRNAYFETCNRNKRGIAVDLKTEEGKEIVYKLVERADVFIENFRKGVPERLGMDYETLRKINPMLIYGSASGYGPEGPDAARPSLDGCGQARAGLMMSATPPWSTEPTNVTGAVSDQMGGIILCLGVLAALCARDKRGVGQKVDVSHLSSTMWLQGLAISMNLLPLWALRSKEPHESHGQRIRMHGWPLDSIHESPVCKVLERLRHGVGSRGDDRRPKGRDYSRHDRRLSRADRHHCREV